MYDEQAMTAASSVMDRAQRNPDAPVSLLPALEDAMMQMEKLHALIAELMVKASPLMMEQTEVAAKMDVASAMTTRPSMYASPAAEKADAICASIRNAQTKIARLARELDA